MSMLERLRRRVLLGDERGQTTAEYALVILGAAIVAGGLALWAKGGAIKSLFDDVISKIL
jgi:Flp pilus assembly pilin Flp